MTGLEGKLALVTGASRGIGLAIAEQLEKAGAHVVRLARSLRDRTTDGRTDVPCDISNTEQVTRAVTRLLDEGRVPHILVNNAGTFLLKPLAETSTVEFLRQLDTNLIGTFAILRELAPRMAEVGGHVVTIGSIADHQTFPQNAAYSAAKHGLRALHGVLAAEYGNRLRTTLISPGATDTQLWDPFDPDHRDDLPSRSAMLDPADVADAVLFAVTRPRRSNIDLIRLSPSGQA